jgi:SOS-response transcriptional repressor LexA
VTDDREGLAERIGRLLAADPASPMWQDERLAAWLAADARERQEAGGGWTDAMMAAAGRDLLARVAARRLGVRWKDEPPVLHSRTVREAPAAAVERARREAATPLVELSTAAGVGRELWDEPVHSWIALPPDIPRGRYVALKVSGDSMEPLMHTGDTILVSVSPEVKAGRVVVARHPDDGYVCKVLARVRRRGLELRSLDASRDPITIPRDPALIVGTVVLVWCDHRPRPAA